MDRRRLLCGAAGLLAGVGLAGCTGSQEEVPVTAEPPPPGVGGDGASEEGATGGDGDVGSPTADRTVAIDDFDAIEGEDGSLVVTITVSNDSTQRQVRLVRATVTIEGVDTVAEQFVAVEGGGTVTVRLPVDVGYRAWLDGGSYVPQVLDRTPATPLPTATPVPTSTETTTQTEGSPTRTPDADTRSETGAGTRTRTGTGTGTPSDATTDSATGTTVTE
jgi:hypothetical protein